MDDPLRHDEALLPLKLDASILQLNDEAAVEDKEELVVVVVFVPVILTLHGAQPHDRIVDLA